MGWTLEDREQSALITWARLEFPNEIIFAIPLGDLRHPAVARRLKATGSLAGVPDLFLARPKPPLGGLFIEMKVRRPNGRKGQVTKVQREMHEKLRRAGYEVVVCWSADEAMDAIRKYLHGVS